MNVRDSVVAAMLLLTACFSFAQDAPVRAEGEGATMSIPSATYQPGASIELTFTAPEGLSDWAWFGVIPSDAPHGKASVNDSHDVAYNYANGKTEGSVSFTAPVKPGAYDIRFSNDAGSDDRELLFLSFVVAAPDTDMEPTLALEKTAFTSHEEFTVKFTVSGSSEHPWIGLIPSEVEHGSTLENDKHDLSWGYIYDQVQGEMSFRAPGPPGNYDLRLGDIESELASVSFTVTAPAELAAIEPGISIDKQTYVSHETLPVHFTAPITYWYTAWVALLPADNSPETAGDADAHDVSYGYLNGRTEGTNQLRVPGLPGQYELRLFTNTGGEGHSVAQLSVTVELPEGGDVAPSLRLDKELYRAGENIVVDFTAPAIFDYNSWLGIVPSQVEHGSTSTNDSHDVAYEYVYGRMQGTVTFKAPEEPGSYDVRLNNGTGLGDGKEHDSVSFVVE